MSVLKIENSKEMSSEEFKQMLQEAWEDGSPLDDLLELVQSGVSPSAVATGI